MMKIIHIYSKSFHHNRDIVYYEMVLIFFMNTITKPHVKRLSLLA